MKNEVRPGPDKILGWAYRPDAATNAALKRGLQKIKDNPWIAAERPHEGGNMAEALAEERAAIEAKKLKPKRRKKVAKKKVTLKDLAARSKKKVQIEGTEKVKKPEKAASGKLIPLKTICADLGIDPKATRVKLRRLIAKKEIDFHDTSARWEFTPSQAKQIREMLQ